MGKKKQPFLDAGVIADISYIEANSPDVLIDLGVFCHILYKREWYGEGKGWTDFPAQWFAENSKMGHRRVRAATKRLVDWGIIQECSGKGKWAGPAKRNPLKFVYFRHPAVEYEDLPERKEKQEELDKLNAKLEKGRPPLKLSASGQPVGISYVWDKEERLLTPIEVSLVEYVRYPICSECGRVFHPTEGRGHEEGVCAECSLLAQVEKLLASEKIKTAHRANIVFPNGEEDTISDYLIEEYAVHLEDRIGSSERRDG